jgi:hypothetical protein
MTRTIELSEKAYAVVCGMVQMTEDVDSDAVCTSADVWKEVREAFPSAEFTAAVMKGLVSYDTEEAEA